MIVDTVRFLKPSEFDVLLNDVNEADLYLIAHMEGAPYLNESSTELPIFPVEGLVMSTHRRYMINLMVRRKNTQPYINVVFLIDTGSPYTFLSRKAIEALMPTATNLPTMLRLDIHGTPSMVCYMSPPSKHFADLNLLGMDFLELKGALIDTDWTHKTFVLHDAESRKTTTYNLYTRN